MGPYEVILKGGFKIMELLGGSSEQEAVTLEVLPASPSATWWSVYGSRLAPDVGWPWWLQHEAAVQWERPRSLGGAAVTAGERWGVLSLPPSVTLVGTFPILGSPQPPRELLNREAVGTFVGCPC